ncbi:MAG TPA: nicotinamide-nucleotide amidohydrolase family protein [Anaerolineae bacterium]|jgi:PncC family amidohydrolase
MLIRKLDYRGVEKARYTGDVLSHDEHRVVIRASWTRPSVNLGFVTFERGDWLRETFYNDRWYNVFELFTPAGARKGWYADITRPARFDESNLEWEDLLLDIWMSPDGTTQLLDEDEFAAATDLPPLEREMARLAVVQLREKLQRLWRADANDRIAELLTRRGWTIGTAESCTGGLIGDELTNRSGSSNYFLGGIISYDNRIKHQALGVRVETLEQHGAVSEACAGEMAAGVRAALGVDVGVSATGIAGPGGGSAEKPVGLVYIGVSTPQCAQVQRYVWTGERVNNKRRTADAALKLLITCLEDN